MLSKNDIVFVKWGRYSSGPFPFDDFVQLGFHNGIVLDIHQIGEIARADVWHRDYISPFYIVKIGDTFYRCYDQEIEPLFVI